MTLIAAAPSPLVRRNLIGKERPLGENPAAVYLSSLGEGSRPTMRHSLNVIASKLTGGEANCFTLDWSKLRYPHTTAIRSWLMEIYQPSTVNKMLCALRRVLYFACKLGQMTSEDSERARDIATLRYETIPVSRAVSTSELAILLVVCAQERSPIGTRDAAMIATLYGTGMLRSSLVKIDLDDYKKKSGNLVVHVKGNKTVLAPLTGGAKLAVDDWLKMRGDKPGPLFCRIWKGGKIKPESRLTSQAVYDIIRRRSGQTGLSPFTPHDLRRSFASDMLDAGVDTVTVMKMIGYASPMTTARYDRRVQEIKRKATVKLAVPYTGILE